MQRGLGVRECGGESGIFVIVGSSCSMMEYDTLDGAGSCWVSDLVIILTKLAREYLICTMPLVI